MSKKTCGCVGVKPNHMKVIIGLGARRVKIKRKERLGTTAEDLMTVLQLEEEPLLEALDDLMGCDVVEDLDAEVFYLTQQGEDLFHGILNAMDGISK